MTILAIVIVSVVVYSALFGVCYATLPGIDWADRSVASGLWPVVMPAVLAYRVTTRVGKWREERRDQSKIPKAEARRR